MTWHPECLDPVQRQVLASLAPLVRDRGYYLAGGTAIALRLGHRKSVDLDWFTSDRIGEPLQLAAAIREAGMPFETSQVDRGTLHGALSGLRLTFLEFSYPLLQPLDSWPECDCPVASPDDLAAMKLSAIAQRGARKDFVDIFGLGLRHLSLPEMLESYQRRFGIQDIAHVLYSLTYFDDAEAEPMPPMLWEVDWDAVRSAIGDWVRAVADKEQDPVV